MDGHTLLIRTDFRDDAAWNALSSAFQATNSDGYRAYITVQSDMKFDGSTTEELLATFSEEAFFFVADGEALTNPEQPVLVVNDDGRTFRVVPSAAWSVENNLSIANMDFEEFEEALGDDGVYRG